MQLIIFASLSCLLFIIPSSASPSCHIRLLPGDSTLAPGSCLQSQPSVFGSVYELVAEAGGLVLYVRLKGSSFPRPYWTWSYYGVTSIWAVKRTCQHPTYLFFDKRGLVELAQNRSATVMSDYHRWSVLCSSNNAVSASSSSADSSRNQSLTFATFGQDVPRRLDLRNDGSFVGNFWHEHQKSWHLDYDFLNRTMCLPETCGWNGICKILPNRKGSICECPPSFTFTNQSDHSRGCHYAAGIQAANSDTCATGGAEVLAIEMSYELTLQELPRGASYFSNNFLSAEENVTTQSYCTTLCLARCNCTSAFFDHLKGSCHLLHEPVATIQVRPSQKHLRGFLKVLQYSNSSSKGTADRTPNPGGGSSGDGSDYGDNSGDNNDANATTTTTNSNPEKNSRPSHSPVYCSSSGCLAVMGSVAGLLLAIVGWLLWVIWSRRKQHLAIISTALSSAKPITQVHGTRSGKEEPLQYHIRKGSSGYNNSDAVEYEQEAQNNVKNEDDSFLLLLSGLPIRFLYRQLQEATANFSHKVGAGGCAVVYRGVLSDRRNTVVAVKRLLQQRSDIDYDDGGDDPSARESFRREVTTICSIHHFNLVRLVGFCSEGPHRLLVYEFMSNGSLDTWLFQRRRAGVEAAAAQQQQQRAALAWSARFRIALDTAQGLAYLHEKCKKKIVHLDIKPENILLDDKLGAKIADFGLSKLLQRDHEEASAFVTRVRGTPGYVAPEFILDSSMTDKCDVYSYGVVLLELVAGRRHYDPLLQGRSISHLPKWAFHKWSQGKLADIVDPLLKQDYDAAECDRMVTVAFWCMQETPDARPSMVKVLQMLEGLVHIPKPSKAPLHLTLGVPAPSRSCSGICSAELITQPSNCIL